MKANRVPTRDGYSRRYLRII